MEEALQSIADGRDIQYMVGNLYSTDHPAIQNTVEKLFQHDVQDTHDLWRFIKTVLSAMRTLQRDLGEARSDIKKKQLRIEELERLTTTDELTQITNRRGFLDAFDREIDRVNRLHSVGGLLMMIDLDNFKTINDTYGHKAGDEALKLVAQTLNAYIRKMDLAARLGGDEFVLLWANADRTSTVDRAQKLARKLNSLVLKYNGHRIPVCASLGMQPYAKGDSVVGVMTKADARMYSAKKESKEKQKN